MSLLTKYRLHCLFNNWHQIAANYRWSNPRAEWIDDKLKFAQRYVTTDTGVRALQRDPKATLKWLRSLLDPQYYCVARRREVYGWFSESDRPDPLEVMRLSLSVLTTPDEIARLTHLIITESLVAFYIESEDDESVAKIVEFSFCGHRAGGILTADDAYHRNTEILLERLLGLRLEEGVLAAFSGSERRLTLRRTSESKWSEDTEWYPGGQLIPGASRP